MSFSRKVLVGLLSGLVVGLFLGELAAPLGVLANAFVKLLQMMVLPYVTISIILSLGRLNGEEAKRLGLRAGAVLAGLWLVALVFVFLFPLAFPRVESGAFFSTTLVEKRQSFDFLGLYIPSNPFHALANNVVPAVVLFSVILGVALIGVERKAVLIDVLSVASTLLSRATRFVVGLTPYGIFAIAANTAGTVSVQDLGRIQVYLATYVAFASLLALWVLPGLVAALTPFRYGEILSATRDALITAFMAGDLFIVLPILIQASKDLFARHGLTDHNAEGLPDVIVPASFNFPHTGKLLSLSFILFAGWFADAQVAVGNYLQLAGAGFLAFFGSLNAAVPFLLDLFRIPADTFQLFLATGVINSRFGSLLAAVHTVAVALLGSAAIVGAVRVNLRRLARYAVVTILLSGLVLGGLRTAFSTILPQTSPGAEVVYGMQPRFPTAEAQVARAPREAQGAEPAGTLLEQIGSRGVLRVCVLPGRLPYAFSNRKEEFVGFDVEMAHLLAQDLGTRVEFVATDVKTLSNLLTSDACDIAMAGIPVTPARASAMLFSQSYLDEALAFVVRDDLRDRFSSWSSIRELGPMRVAVPDVPYYISQVRAQAPALQLEPLPTTWTPDQVPPLDALLMPAERGAVLTLLYPRFAVVVPEPGIIKVPLAYPLARGDQGWAAFVNTWIELKRKDGTIDELYRHWILGRGAVERKPRWSVVRNVLHWVR